MYQALLLSVFAFVLAPLQGFAQCEAGSTCVADQDLQDLITLAEEAKCLKTEVPTYEMGSFTITTDEDGRVYYSGAAPHPLTMRMKWCHYTVDAEARLNVIVAKKVPDVWGFRFRVKFAGSFLFLDAVERSPQDAVDVGLLWEFFYWKDLNVNVATGFRSAGLGVGYDITRNFGAFAGYAFSFWTLRSNPQAGLYFGF